MLLCEVQRQRQNKDWALCCGEERGDTLKSAEGRTDGIIQCLLVFCRHRQRGQNRDGGTGLGQRAMAGSEIFVVHETIST